MISDPLRAVDKLDLPNLILQNTQLWQEFRSPDLKILNVSPYCEQVSGYSSYEFLEDPKFITRITLQEDRDELNKWISNSFNRSNNEFSFRIKNRNGNVYWLKAIRNPIYVEDNQLIGFLFTYQDITELKNLKDDYQQKDEILNALLEAPKNILSVIDLEGKIYQISDLFAEKVNSTKEELIGKSIWDIFPPDSTKLRKKWIDQVIQSRQTLRVEDKSTIDASSSEIYDTIIHPILDKDGEVNRLVIIARDVTKYRKIEEELNQSKRQFEIILEYISDGIFVLDRNGEVLFTNQAAQQQIIYPAEEFYKDRQNLVSKFVVAREDGSPIAWEEFPSHQALKGQKPDPMVIRYSHPGFNSHDENWLVINAQPIFGEDGQIEMVMVISNDITELKISQQEIERAHVELEKRITYRTKELSRVIQSLERENLIRREAEKQARESAAYAQALVRIAQRLSAQLDLNTLLNLICQEAAQATVSMLVKDCNIYLYDEDQDALIKSADHILYGDPPDFYPIIPRDIYLSWLNHRGMTILVTDVNNLENLSKISLPENYLIHTYINVSMWNDGELIGFLEMYSEKENDLPKEKEITLIQAIASQATSAIVNARLFEDITKARNRLQNISQKLVKVQEEERRQLARELHDEFGGMLTSIRINLDIISQSQNQLQLQALAQARNLTDKLVEQIRELSLNLRPTLLDDFGLLPALITLIEQYQQRTNITVDFKHNGINQRFPTEIETTAFRTIQEALTNAARHANVDHVAVRAWFENDIIKIQIKDEGKGFLFDKNDFSYRTSGLSGMRERVKMVQGIFEIETAPGEGTCITEELPINFLLGEESW